MQPFRVLKLNLRFNINDDSRHVCLTSNKQCLDEDMKTKVLHVYTSLGGNSPTFGRHNDGMDVLIIQSIGSIQYKIDNDTRQSDTVTLNPGDGIIIRRGVYHTPIIKEPRVTLSFSWT